MKLMESRLAPKIDLKPKEVKVFRILGAVAWDTNLN
jgi:hypothetical protein